jgi:hypothetical protein
MPHDTHPAIKALGERLGTDDDAFALDQSALRTFTTYSAPDRITIIELTDKAISDDDGASLRQKGQLLEFNRKLKTANALSQKNWAVKMDLRTEIELSKSRELDANENALAACFPAAPALSDETRQRVLPFVQWCETQRVRALPAKPFSVAAFVRAQLDQRVPRQVIVETLASIEALHNAASVGNPVSAPVVAATLGTTIDPPRSWAKADKEFFATLPLHAQSIIADREQERETHLRRSQNALAEERKRLQAAADPKPVTTATEKVN